MKPPRKNAAKTRGRPFAAGNPGKPKGARHRVTRAVEELLEGQHVELTQVAIREALAGDMVALRLCLDRIAPPRKDAPVTIALPEVRTAADAAKASTAVLAAVAIGEISPDEATRVMAILTAHRNIIETADIDRRLSALEDRQPLRK